MVFWLVQENRFISFKTTGFCFLGQITLISAFLQRQYVFLFVCDKIGLFWSLSCGNNVFPFSFLNYVVFCFMALETCFHSFAVKFCCFNVMSPKKGFLFSVARLYCLRRCRTEKKVFFLFAANHTNFFSILVKTNWRPNHAVFSFNAPEACFGLLCVKSRCFRLFSWKRFLYFAI